MNRSIASRCTVFAPGLAALGLAMALLAACGRRETAAPPRPGPPAAGPFRPYDSTRVVMDSLRADVAGDSLAEWIITSRTADGGAPGFDRVEVFALDAGAGRWRSLFVDPVNDGARLLLRDVTGDGRDEVVVETDGGGNDPLASRGMDVYGRRNDGAFTVLFFAAEGAPELRDLDGDGRPEILLTAEYAGLMPRAEGITYTSGVYAYDGAAFTLANDRLRAWFDAIIAGKRLAMDRLRGARAGADPATLYRAAADWLLWSTARATPAQLRAAWDGVRESLRARLSAGQFDDLASLVRTEEDLQHAGTHP
jgi:hypothetical protein